jgi:CRP/FNR family transcriptional regulator
MRDFAVAVDCKNCPLREKPLFVPMTAEEQDFMRRFKTEERKVEPGTRLLEEGEESTELYTVLDGMGLRFKTLEDGERQVLAFVMPGDFLGLQAAVMQQMEHSVEARTEMTLCVFRREALWQLFEQHPERGFDLAWLAAVEEHFLGDSLAAVGQMPARERIARALWQVQARGAALGLMEGGSMPLPFIQLDLADALGLSLVHTNRILGQFRKHQIVSWREGRLQVHDAAALRRAARLPEDACAMTRPLI